MRREQAERGIFLVAPVDSRLAEEARVGNALPRKREERPDERYDVVVRRVMVLLIDADRGDVGAFGGPPGQRALRDDAIVAREVHARVRIRSEEHTSELQSLMRISYAVFCLKKKKQIHTDKLTHNNNKII